MIQHKIYKIICKKNVKYILRVNNPMCTLYFKGDKFCQTKANM